MPSHFLIDQTLTEGQEIILDAERSHYLCRVMRLRVGSSFACFDGHGHAAQATLVNADRRKASIAITQVAPPLAASPWQLHLGLSIVKGAAMDRAVQVATELGVSHLWLLSTQRSNVKIDDSRRTHKLQHWQKIAASAAEQCGRLILPKLAYTTLPELVKSASEQNIAAMVFVPGADALPQTLDICSRLLLVGPEGGWDTQEMQLFADQQVQQVALGKLILRAESMPAVALSLIQSAQEWRIT